MFKNHLKTALRLFIRNKVYTLINLFGLSLALMICFFAYLYISDEFSYDRFHKNSDRLFLINQVNYSKDVTDIEADFFSLKAVDGIKKSPIHNLPFLKQAETTIPEIEKLVRMETNYVNLVKDGLEFEEYTKYVDEDFFKVLGFEFLFGNAEVALNDLSSAVVSEDFAIKHFGKTNVIGEEISLGGKDNPIYVIKGVLSSSQKSVIKTNLFLRIELTSYFKTNQDNWQYNAVAAFVLLNNAESDAIVNDKLRAIEVGQRGEASLVSQREMLKLGKENPVVTYQLKPIAGLFLDSSIPYGLSSSPVYSMILAAIAMLILIIACINYLSISIASSAARRAEIAIRKVVGADLWQLKGQFYSESFVLTTIAILIGFTLTQALMPMFNELAAKEFDLSLTESFTLLGYGFIFGLLLTFLAGGYPAQILSRFKVLGGLKGKGSHRVKPGLLKGMVVFQFTLCMIFISTSLMMKKQFTYINNKDLGFDKEQVVYVDGVWGKTDLFKQELAKHPAVMSASGSTGIFVGSSSFGVFVLNGVQQRVQKVQMDKDLFSTIGLEVIDVEGLPKVDLENLSKEKSLVNETYYNAIQQDSAMARSMASRIGGVVKDFHFESLQNEISNIIFSVSDKNGLSTLFVKLAPNQIEEGLSVLKATYAQLTEQPLNEVRFLDDYINARYKDSEKWQKIVNVSASIGVLIASIGLFGLTGIQMDNQMKELSIRKVLGAGSRDITFTLNKQSFIITLVSSFISIPVSYYLMESWLTSFAYHESITPDLFMLAMLLLLGITALTVTYHSVKVINSNPANVLRSE
ncbi:MAG: putative ABC transport system permease protein [Roseivirga sp.]|jgi:putative ABC transport system permease protein